MAISLDEFVRLSDVKFPNHIKIDVDGLEGIIVENMKNIMNDVRLKSLIIEIAVNLSKGRIEKEIKKYGFKEKFREILDPKGETKNILIIKENNNKIESGV